MTESLHDAEGDMAPRKTSALERHFQTFVLLSAIGLLAWVGHSLETTNESAVRLDERVKALSDSIRDLKDISNKVYTRIDAEKDFQVVNGQISDLRSRVYAVENAIHDRNTPKSPTTGELKEWARKN